MSTIVNDRDVLLQAAATRLLTVALPSNQTVDFSQVGGATKPADNADVTTSILAASGTSIVMTSSQLFKSSSGTGGVFIGAGGLIGKTTGGVTTFSINATTGAVSFLGSITGASTLDITGQCKFKGAFTDVNGNQSAVEVNGSGASNFGLTAIAKSGGGGAAVYGLGAGNGTHGVMGENLGTGNAVSGLLQLSGSTGNAVSGLATVAGAVGVAAGNTAGGTALKVTGKFEIANTVTTPGTGTATLLANKPGANANFQWVAVTVNGTLGYFPWVAA